MITFHRENKILIPQENGIPLCHLDALSEAEAWVRQHEGCDRLAVIVGLGAGYHVQAWLAAHPGARAVVIDSRPALLNSFWSRLSGEARDRVEVIIIESLDGLLHHEVMADIAEDLPSILLFEPALGEQRALLESCFKLCTGRSWLGLSYFIEAFGIRTEGQIERSTDGRLLTIKDLGIVVDTAAPDHPRAPLIRLLRELIV